MSRSINKVSVAVVGGAGFLGSHVVDHLIDDRGCNVLVVDNLEAGRTEFVHPKADFEHHDVTGSEDHLAQLFADRGVRFVLNYSARPYVPDAYERPLRTFDVNAMGALKVINAARVAGAEGILQVSSAEVYGGRINLDGRPEGNVLDCPLDEWAPVMPVSSYGASKAAIDALVQVRWREDRTPCIALRQFNCVGARETHPYVVPEIISQLSAQIPAEYRGRKVYNPRFDAAVVNLGNNSSRDFLWAGDAARMAVELLERGRWGEVYNLGSEESIKVYDLAALVGKVMGFAEVRVQPEDGRRRAWELWSLKSCNAKINAVISARPSLGLEGAIRLAVEWFEGNGRRWPWERGTR